MRNTIKYHAFVKLLLFLAFVRFPVAAFLCEEQFYVQFGMQTILEGPDANNLQVTQSAIVSGGFGEVAILSDSTEYRIIAGFEGSCDEPTKKPIVHVVKQGGSSAFVPVADSTFIKLYDNPLVGTNFALWFGLSDSASGPIRNAIGADVPGDRFYLWYASATFVDSIRPPSGLWQWSTNYYRNLFTGPDSIRLDSAMLASWRAEDIGGVDRRAWFRVQFLKVFYDTIPTGIRPRARSATWEGIGVVDFYGSPFEISGVAAGGLPSTVRIHAINGRRIRVLNRTGQHYRWNGRAQGNRQVASSILLICPDRGLSAKAGFLR